MINEMLCTILLAFRQMLSRPDAKFILECLFMMHNAQFNKVYETISQHFIYEHSVPLSFRSLCHFLYWYLTFDT